MPRARVFSTRHSVPDAGPPAGSIQSIRIDCGYRIDMLVAGEVLIELKSVEQLSPLHEAQILTYLKLSGLRRGLLLNFNVRLLKKGIRSFLLD
jgi:GxxExxY protein